MTFCHERTYVASIFGYEIGVGLFLFKSAVEKWTARRGATWESRLHLSFRCETDEGAVCGINEICDVNYTVRNLGSNQIELTIL